jgi:hypothetical protein
LIDHLVTIKGIDVSNEVIKINVQQAVDSDSEPGKTTITLANPHQKYTNFWPPQITPFKVILYNWRYNSENERAAAGGHAEAEYLVATGHMTNLKANPEEAIVSGECDLGHLADAIRKDFEGIEMPITAKQCLETILSWHDDEPITLVWDPELPDKTLDKVPYNADNTYQDVCDDIASIVGAVYYFGENNVLYFMSPTSNTGTVDLDPYVTNPDQTTSINGFRNIVVVVGNQTLAASGEDSIDPEGATTPGSEPIIGYAEDLDSIDEVGPLIAPAEYAYNLKTQAAVDARAKQLLELYKMYKNAETKVSVAGIVPPLMSKVQYSPFLPISDIELAKANAAFAARLKELQERENARAILQDRLPRTIGITSKVKGIVIAKQVEYSIDGLFCEVTISPGMLDMTSIVTDENIDEGEGGEGQQYPHEDE